MHSFDELCARFKATPHGDKADAHCPGPGHKNGDRRKSLSIRHDPGKGRHYVKCHGGCSQEDVLEAVGLTWHDLVPERAGRGQQRPKQPPPEARYDYRDEDGRLLFQVFRTPDKNFPQRRPARPDDPADKVKVDEADGTRWVWSMTGVRRVLYRLPEVLEAVKSGRVVFVLEGEKDCNNAVRLGLDATTSPQGAGNWKPDYAESLAGANVVVVPDNDPDNGPVPYKGQKHAADAARSLEGKASRVRVLELPPERGGRTVKDFSDWQAAGGTKDELLQLAEAAPDAGAWLAAWQDRLAQSPSPGKQGEGHGKNKSKQGRSGSKPGATPAPAPPPPPDPEAVRKAAEAARLAAGDLWTAPDVLERFYREAEAAGLVREEANAKVVILAVTSRVTARPVNVLFESDTGSGKTYTVENILRLFPPDCSYTFHGASALAFVYDPADFRHRTLFLNEVDAFAVNRRRDSDNSGAAMLRTMLESDKIVRAVTEELPTGGRETRHYHKQGPVGCILTGCHGIDREAEDRCIKLAADEALVQARRIVERIGMEAAGKAPQRKTPLQLHALQWYLQVGAPWEVVIPFAEGLAVLDKIKSNKVRRGFKTLLSLVKAHALLHVGSRDRDSEGRILATVDDYRPVFEIAAAVFPAEDSGLSPKQREAVEAACAICREGGRGTARSIGERLGLSRTAVLSRLRAGERAGFLQRCDDGKPGSTNQWQPGEELPTATSWLRPPGEVSELWGQKQPAVKADEPPELVTPLVTPPELPQVKADCGREAVCAAGGDTPLVTPLVTPDKSEHPQDSCGPGGSGNGGVTSCDPKGQGAQAAVSPLILSPSPVLPVDTHAPATPDSEAGLCYWAPKSRRGPDGASTATKRRPYSKPLTAPVPPELQEAFEERAAIREHCGGQTRKDAEAGALEDLAAGRNVGAGAKPRTEEKGGLPPLGAER